MQFNSYIFIFEFLPLAVLLYWMGRKISIELGKIVLILTSLLFYYLGASTAIPYLLVSVGVNYLLCMLISRMKMESDKGQYVRFLIFLTVVCNVLALLYFKYYNFFVSNINGLAKTGFDVRNILLPLGISFYTFQQIAYVVELSRGGAQYHKISDYLCYILYFPKLIMGPLSDPTNFISEINDENRKINTQNIAIGVKLFSLGLAKKVLLADRFAEAVNWVYENLDNATSMDCILLVLFYTFEIYFDFSGYSDMAVGISRLFDIDIPVNFNSPYKALSIRDFWKRWHMSLTSFLTKHIYIPLGGSRKGVLATYVNTMIVFFISGLWHGANWTFILWGIIHGALSCAERACHSTWEKVFIPVRWIITFCIVSILWLLFSASSIGEFLLIIKKIMLLQDLNASEGLIMVFSSGVDSLMNNIGLLSQFYGNVRGFKILGYSLMSFVLILIPANNLERMKKFNVGYLLLAAIGFILSVISLGVESTFVYYGF